MNAMSRSIFAFGVALLLATAARADVMRATAVPSAGGPMGDLLGKLPRNPAAPKKVGPPLTIPKPVAPKADAPKGSYLRMVLRVSEDGKIEVEGATEIVGDAPTSDVVRGPFASEVSLGDAVVAAQSVQDPFEKHSIGGPQPGHHFFRDPAGFVVVDVPRAKVADADRIGVKLFRIRPEGGRVDRIDIAKIRELRAQNRLQSIGNIPTKRLGGMLRDRENAKRIPIQPKP